MPYTIECEGLTKSYGDVPVLRGLDLRVEGGSVFALLGANGAGKTTTIKILSTLTAPDGGRASVAGHDVVRAPRRVREAITLTGQHAAVDELLTAEENLLMLARLRHLRRPQARRRCEQLLERFDLGHVRDRRAGTFSGGTRRRLDIAVGLVTDPPVIFLDEPTTGLDPRSRRAVWETVEQLAATGATILLTTQYLEEADRLADRIAVLDGGRIAAEGTATALKRDHGAETLDDVFMTVTARSGA